MPLPALHLDAGTLIAIVAVNFPLLALFVYAQHRGWLVSGRAHQEQVNTLRAEIRELREQRAQTKDDYEARLQYMDERRREEREGRVAAEKRVSLLTETTTNLTRLLQEVRVELARVFGRPFAPSGDT